MGRQTKKNAFVFNAILSALALTCCVACATQSINEAPRQRDLLFAEHSAMKKRLPLVERENDVLAKENDHYRRWVQDLQNNIKKLTDDLAATQADYSRDLAAKREEINALEISIQNLEEEKARQIAALNTAMVAQENEFIAQRKQLIKEKEQKESVLSNQLADKNKELDANAVQISELTSGKAELEAALGKKQLELKDLIASQATLESELESKRRTILELAAANAKNAAKLSESNEMITSLKKDRDKSMAELESAKAANADLVKTFNELFNQLQLKKDQSGTQI